METKEIVITPPEGFEVDEENSTFQKILFKKKGNGFSKDWKEFCKKHKKISSEYYIGDTSDIYQLDTKYSCRFYDKNLLPSKEYAEAMLALCQLLTIREKEYTKGWEPDWSSPIGKNVICIIKNEPVVSLRYNTSQILFFPTRELAEEFLKNWKDLIEIAKPLL